jgi:AcrR family transcriptional regulator
MNKTFDLPINKRKRQLNKQQNRDSIILASRKVFTEKGLDSSNVREIVCEAGLGSGTFYNYFDDKVEVFLVIVNRLINEFSNFIIPEINKAKTFDELVNIAFNSWFNWISNDAENYIFFKNNKKYILDLKWLGQNSKEYQNFNKKLLEVTVNMSNVIRFPQNDISLMVTSVIAVSVNLGDQLLERNDLKPSEVSLFATKLFLKGL